MTGSLVFNRQYSSTAGYSNMNKMTRPKLRRCSSADDHSITEVTRDDIEQKLFLKRKTTPCNSDSGIEDNDQQIINIDNSQSNDLHEEEPLSCFGACEDEDTEEYVTENIDEIVEDPEQKSLRLMYNDIVRAAKIPDDEKKEFCANTREVFHGEFARRVLYPILLNYYGVSYTLFAEDEVHGNPCDWYGFHFVRLDNAKAQFKCSNTYCGRLWTSMRARISFKVSQPQPNGFVVLKVFGQACQSCDTPAEALWYPEEVCRVMENLSKEIFMKFFPEMISYDDLQDFEVKPNGDHSFRRVHHDPNQRKGKMRASHDSNHCEACQFGWCYAWKMN